MYLRWSLNVKKDGTYSQGQQYKTEKKILAPPCDVKQKYITDTQNTMYGVGKLFIEDAMSNSE